MQGRRRKFVDEYILTGSATEAARRAGYAEKYISRQGHSLLKNPEVRSAIDERLAQIDSEKILKQQQLLEFLSAVVRGEIKDETALTKMTGKGCSEIVCVELRTPTRERIRAAELLLKIQGAFNKAEGENDINTLFVSTLEAVWKNQTPA